MRSQIGFWIFPQKMQSKGAVTLCNVSCNLSRFDDHMRLKEHFHWLVPQTVATQVAGQMLHRPMLKNSLQPMQKAELNAGQILHRAMLKNAESRTGFYFPERFLQLVSQRFWPLQGMLHWAMIRATCLAMGLRDKLHEKLHSVTPL